MKCPEAEELELYALRRVRDPDPKVVEHLRTCPYCIEAAEEAREWAQLLKIALTDMQKGKA
jgi:hypothetical protein